MERYQALKELALEFKRTRDSKIFVRIAVKIDGFLFYTIYKARRVKPHLRRVELQDLYQTAIIGLYNALLKVKEEEPGSKLLYKISRYIGNEITKWYKRRILSADDAFIIRNQIENKLIDDTEVYKDFEMACIRERFSRLVEDDVISLEEFDMLTMRFVDAMTYKEIAKQFGKPSGTISKRIEDALNRMRYEFRRRGWEGI